MTGGPAQHPLLQDVNGPVPWAEAVGLDRRVRSTIAHLSRHVQGIHDGFMRAVNGWLWSPSYDWNLACTTAVSAMKLAYDERNRFVRTTPAFAHKQRSFHWLHLERYWEIYGEYMHRYADLDMEDIVPSSRPGRQVWGDKLHMWKSWNETLLGGDQIATLPPTYGSNDTWWERCRLAKFFFSRGWQAILDWEELCSLATLAEGHDNIQTQLDALWRYTQWDFDNEERIGPNNDPVCLINARIARDDLAHLQDRLPPEVSYLWGDFDAAIRQTIEDLDVPFPLPPRPRRRAARPPRVRRRRRA